jgi:3-oxoacyl-[acyl-carrier protein] reductase
MFDDLKNKTVVVTGGVTGIGGAASRAFAAAGAKVLAHYHAGGPELEVMRSQHIATTQLDLTAAGGPLRLMQEARERFGRVDVLVNNAGSLVKRVPLAELDDDFID